MNCSGILVSDTRTKRVGRIAVHAYTCSVCKRVTWASRLAASRWCWRPGDEPQRGRSE